MPDLAEAEIDIRLTPALHDAGGLRIALGEQAIQLLLVDVLTRRVAELLGDDGMAGLMDFYQCYRAYVRGKVESFHSVAEIANDEERLTTVARAL